jgi:DNA-binding protein HU-beta
LHAETHAHTAFQRIAENTQIEDNYANLLKSLSDVNFSRYYSLENWPKKFCGFEKASKFVTANFLKLHTMNKAELISKISDDAGITKTQANTALDSFVEAVTKTLKGGGKVTLVGFGTFSVSKRAARNGRNPQTGAVIKIKAKKVARFKAGKELSGKL